MTDDAVTDDVHNDTPSNEEQESAQGGLTISDLRILKMSVEAATQRGGFQANEMATVGNTYNKLAMFLAQVDAQQAEANGEASDDDSNETAEKTAEE